MEPITRQEQLLDSIATGNSVELEPITREEQYLSAIAGLTDFIPEKPITRKEMFYAKILENGGGGGGTSEGINLGYTLNKDGTYIPIDESKDGVFPVSDTALGKFVFVSDKIYTVDELLGHTIRTKTINVSDGIIEEIKDIEITADLIVPMVDGWVLVNEIGIPVLTVITESEAGQDLGFGFPLPSNVGTYLAYVDFSLDRQGEVFGSVSVKKPLGKPYIDTSKITDFSYFCYGGARTDVIDDIDTSNGTSFNSMFYGCVYLNNVPLFDMSNGTNFNNMFKNCESIKTIPLFDTSKGTTFRDMFNGCRNLLSVPLLDFSNATELYGFFYNCRKLATVPAFNISKATNTSAMFYNCEALEILPLLDISSSLNSGSMFSGCKKLKTVSLTTAKTNLDTNTFYNCLALENLTIGEGWAVNIYLHYSNNLTVESLHGMIENLADLTGSTAKTFQIGATNLAKIDEEHIAMLQAKNWNYS